MFTPVYADALVLTVTRAPLCINCHNSTFMYQLLHEHLYVSTVIIAHLCINCHTSTFMTNMARCEDWSNEISKTGPLQITPPHFRALPRSLTPTVVNHTRISQFFSAETWFFGLESRLWLDQSEKVSSQHCATFRHDSNGACSKLSLHP